MDRKTLLITAIVVEGGLALIGYLLLGSSAARLWSGFKISWETTVYALLGCIPMFLALVFSMRSNWKPILQLREDILEKIRPIFSNSKLIDLAIIAESARWGDAKVLQPRTKDDDWLPQVEYLLDDYLPFRTDVVLGQLRAKGWYTN